MAEKLVLLVVFHLFLAARLVNICFAFEEEGRIYQNILDKNKLTTKRLQDCLVDESITVSVTSTDNSFEQIVIHLGNLYNFL